VGGFGVILTGAAQGGEYALLVLGFVLTWSATRIVNLAQGAVAVAGAYIAWQLQVTAGLPVLLDLVPAAVVLLASGCAAGYCAVPALRHRPSFVVLVITFGVGLILQGLLTVGFGDDYRSLAPALASPSPSVGAAAADLTSLAVIAACGVCCGAGIALSRSRLGRVMAAVGSDRDTARTLGIPPRRIESLAMGLGGACAGVAGVLAGTTGVFHPPDAGRFTLICAITAIAVGTSSPVRAVVAAWAIGLGDAVARDLLNATSAAVAEVTVLVIVLLARGTGFLQDDELCSEPKELTQ
jgi:branched-chain amino acid transport system permease protein